MLISDWSSDVCSSDLSSDVLIDSVYVRGASDAGIYVGQSKNIVVRDSVATENVAGIEIENSYDADVHDNVATKNTGGILVFDLPSLPMQGGHNVRVFERSEEHTSELQSLMRISYAVFCLKKTNNIEKSKTIK